MRETAAKAAIKTVNKDVKHVYPEFDHRSQLEHVLAKAEAQGLNQVVEFLVSKARKSPRTARVYYHALDDLSAFIAEQYDGKYDIQTIVSAVKRNKIDLYQLLNSFVNFLQRQNSNAMARTIALYISAVKSYFAYHDIDVNPSKFRCRVSLPSVYKEDEQAIDSNDIKNILHHCNNRRLKAYLLVLASGGMRAMEALGIRECDVSFNGINFADPTDKAEPALVHIRKEFSKTKRDRNIFISNEAARYLNEWLEWKYRNLSNPSQARREGKEDFIFSRGRHARRYPIGLYNKIAEEFRSVLVAAGFSLRKEDGVFKRRNVTLHSFRRFVKTTIANQTRNSDYSEWFLGHKKSPYYTNKPDELRRIYKEDCMKYLTFLDYPTIEATGKSFEAKIREKDREIESLRLQIKEISVEKKVEKEQTTDAIGDLMQVIEGMKKQIKELQDKQK